MTDENSTKLTPTEGAPASPKQSVKKNVAASAQEPSEPRAIPFPSPSIPREPVEEPGEDEEDGLVLTDADFASAVGHEETRILKAQNAKQASAWGQGPGQMELLVEGVKLAKWAAKKAGTPMSQIDWLIAKALPEANLVVVAPALEGAKGAIEARTRNGALHFNISDILRAAKMEISSGYRHLYPVKRVAESPIGPAIAINLGAKPLDTKRVETKKKKKA
ncbi:MAG TPA: hypothetical protein VK191_02795 [Symbiobacteriaceae bacterium]|nr:hypothetical protein [Symbiobacteriaceae bacterium]